VGEDEPEAQALGGRRRVGARRLGDGPWHVGHQDAIGRGGARHRGDASEQQKGADDLSTAA
jgi:hypothetical protein